MGYREPRALMLPVEAYCIRPASSRGGVVGQVVIIRVLYERFFGGDIVSVGYAIAHPRLNPVGILPPGSLPSDVHSHDNIIVVVLSVLSCSWMRHYRGRCGDIITVDVAALT